MPRTKIPGFEIREAAPSDVPLILSFIKGIADYEKLADEVVATEDGLREHLFALRPAAEVCLGFLDGEAAAFAVFFHNFSTFLGRPGLHLEDLYVKPEFRGKGIGSAMLSHVARIAVERKCGRFEWAVLDWNEPAIELYKKLGARAMSEWTIFRMTGDAIRNLAQQ